MMMDAEARPDTLYYRRRACLAESRPELDGIVLVMLAGRLVTCWPTSAACPTTSSRWFEGAGNLPDAAGVDKRTAWSVRRDPRRLEQHGPVLDALIDSAAGFRYAMWMM